MRCLSVVCDELEDNPVDSRECAEYEGVFHNTFPNSGAALYLQRDNAHITVYFSQVCMHTILSQLLNWPHLEYWLVTWTVMLLQYQKNYWCGIWFYKKYGKLQLLPAHSSLNSIALVCLLIYGWLGLRRNFYPPIPWNMCIEIQACAPWNSIFKNCN